MAHRATMWVSVFSCAPCLPPGLDSLYATFPTPLLAADPRGPSEPWLSLDR